MSMPHKPEVKPNTATPLKANPAVAPAVTPKPAAPAVAPTPKKV